MEFDKETIETNAESCNHIAPICKSCFDNELRIKELETKLEKSDEMSNVKIKILSQKIFKL